MDLKKLVEAIDAQVLTGDIIGAFEQHAAEDCITHSNPQDITHSKGQKTEALRWFFSNVAAINNITLQGVSIENDNETKSQFVFDFTNKQNQPLVYSEVIRRVWKNGKLVEEQYMFNETIAKTAKKAKADAVAAPAPSKATPAKKATEKKAVSPKAASEKKAAEPKATEKKAAAPKAAPAKADDLTIIEGIGPKIAELLIKAGIVTFADLAKTKPAAIKTILDAAGKRYQMHDPATWPKQATLARDGKTVELAKLQNELKGGK